MFGDKFKRKYALSDKGVHNTKMGMLWTIVVNLLMMGGMGLLYFMMQSFISTLTEGGPLPNTWLYIGLTALFVILSLIYDTPVAEGADSFAPDGHDIVFENVGFAYDNEQVLKGVSFTAKEGEVTALVGPSGSGKSTCARLAARLWDITNGTIRVGGVDINTVDPETLLSDYSMVFQDVVLFDDTVMENIRLGRHGATDEEVIEAAKAANCDEFVEKLPNGYDTQIGENGAKLSGGERQRISIARALLKNAPIVLLDEATASLDVENETKVQGALSKLLQNKTVLVIAHRMRTVEAADKIVVLKDGMVAEQGKPEDLMNTGGEFAKMVNLQSESAKWAVAGTVTNKR